MQHPLLNQVRQHSGDSDPFAAFQPGWHLISGGINWFTYLFGYSTGSTPKCKYLTGITNILKAQKPALMQPNVSIAVATINSHLSGEPVATWSGAWPSKDEAEGKVSLSTLFSENVNWRAWLVVFILSFQKRHPKKNRSWQKAPEVTMASAASKEETNQLAAKLLGTTLEDDKPWSLWNLLGQT